LARAQRPTTRVFIDSSCCLRGLTASEWRCRLQSAEAKDVCCRLRDETELHVSRRRVRTIELLALRSGGHTEDRCQHEPSRRTDSGLPLIGRYRRPCVSLTGVKAADSTTHKNRYRLVSERQGGRNVNVTVNVSTIRTIRWRPRHALPPRPCRVPILLSASLQSMAVEGAAINSLQNLGQTHTTAPYLDSSVMSMNASRSFPILSKQV